VKGLKYIIVTGGVMSGLGKGITTASIGRILKNRGYEVTAVKIDPYLNIDAGTMNPAQHGEVFVLSDGSEVDLDLGNYERFLNINLNSAHNLTTGKVYRNVIEKERRGDYLGSTVQIIPHVTDEIKSCIKKAAAQKINGSTPEICLVEVGGTVGDIESMPFLEAVRQMRGELSSFDVVLIHVTLVPVDTMGELKTKPTQHSVKALREVGIQPDFIVARSTRTTDRNTKKKISAFCDVPPEAVISAATVPDIYDVPLELERDGLADVLCERLHLEKREPDTDWYRTVMKGYTGTATIAIVSKYGIEDVYISIKEALKHAGRSLATQVEIVWMDAEHLNKDTLGTVDGILVPGGFGSRGVEGKLEAIEFARTRGIPYLGLCFGFQLAVIEYAQHVLGWRDASSEEIGKGRYVIAILPEQQNVTGLGGTMRLGNYPITVQEGTLMHRLYGKKEIVERHRHRYEVNPQYLADLEGAGLIFSSKNRDRMESCEIREHPFYLATQFHPEFTSRPTQPSPPFVGLVRASIERKAFRKKSG
jgi:CTP synthase